MRRLLKYSLCAFGLGIIAIALSPFWMGFALRILKPTVGLSFEEYTRDSYTEFTLSKPVWENENVTVSIDSLKMETPFLWLYKHLFSEPKPIKINKWKVVISEAPEEEGALAQGIEPPHPAPETPTVATPPAPLAETTPAPTTLPPTESLPSVEDPETFGLLSLLETLTTVHNILSTYLSQTEIGRGSVVLPNGSHIALRSLNWKENTISAKALSFGTITADVSIHFNPDTQTWALGLKHPLYPISADASIEQKLDTEKASASVILNGQYYKQPLTLNAFYDSDAWIPATAQLLAPDWRLPADHFNLPAESYLPIQITGNLVWENERFDFKTTAHAPPFPNTENPPIDIDLEARGSLENVTISTLIIDVPGLNARLSSPIEIDSTLEFLSKPTQFSLQSDIEKLSFIKALGKASGHIDGTLSVSPKKLQPAIELHLEAKDLRIPVNKDFVEVISFSLDANLQDAVLTLRKLSLVDKEQSKLDASAVYDTKKNLLIKAGIDGLIEPQSILPILPESLRSILQNARLSLNATASGAIDKLQHKGALSIKTLNPPLVQPLAITASWETDQNLNLHTDATITSQTDTSNKLDIQNIISPDFKIVTISDLTLYSKDKPALLLSAPSQYSANHAELHLHSPDEHSKLTLNATLAEKGSITLDVLGISSALLNDWLLSPPPRTEISTLDLNAHWQPRGKLNATLNTLGNIGLPNDSKLPECIHWNIALKTEDEQLNIHATLSEVANLEASSEGVPRILLLEGGFPLIIKPQVLFAQATANEEALVVVDQKAPIHAKIETNPSSPLWDHLSKLTGIKIVNPNVSILFHGTPETPQGTVKVTIDKLSPENERWKNLIPPIEAFRMQISATEPTISLDELSLLVAGSPVKISASVPAPFTEWPKLWNDPLNLLYTETSAHVQIPETNIAPLAPYISPQITPAGRMAVDLFVTQKNNKPHLDGSVILSEVETRPLGTTGISIKEINANIQFQGDNICLDQLSASIGSQPLLISGNVSIADPLTPDLNIAAKGEDLPLVRTNGLLIRSDIDVQISGPFSITGGTEHNPTISGRLVLRDSLYLSTIRSLIPVGDTRSGPISRPPYFSVDEEPLSRWKLDLDIHGHRFMRIRMPVFTGLVSAFASLKGSLGSPLLTGEATITNSQIILPFMTLTTQNARAVITPAAPYEVQLSVDASARRYGYDVRLNVSGTDLSPVISLSSSPALSSEEILFMVMAGDIPDTTSGVSQTTGNQRAAKLGAYLGQSLLNQYFGDPMEEDRITISVGERISEQNRETYDIDYRLTSDWTLNGQYDEYDEYNIGLKRRFYGKTKSTQDESSDLELPSFGIGNGESASFTIRGLGFFRNLDMRIAIRRLLGENIPSVIDTTSIEDILFLTFTSLEGEGFLRPTITLILGNPEGKRMENTVDPSLQPPLPRPFNASNIRMQINPGVRYTVRTVNISGETHISEKEVRGFFIPDNVPIISEIAKAYSPARLRDSAEALESTLHQQGYRSASVTAKLQEKDDKTGYCTVLVEIKEGPLSQVTTLDLSQPPNIPGVTDKVEAQQQLAKASQDAIGQAWSPLLRQDIASAIRQVYYEEGYPDVQITIKEQIHEEPDGDAKIHPVHLSVDILPGPRVKIASIHFSGSEVTRMRTLRRTIKTAKEGEYLNPNKLEESRSRLTQLNAYSKVEVKTETVSTEGKTIVDPSVEYRDVVFELNDLPPWDVSFLIGYGSYEQLRGGFELRQNNVFGRAQQSYLQFVQSMKSTRGEYLHTFHHIFNSSIDANARLYGLHRKERSFDREEYGANFSIYRRLHKLGLDANAGYTFESLRNKNQKLSSEAPRIPRTDVASLNFGISRDRRDNPLIPRRGYRFFLQTEFAAKNLGGEINYQRFELGTSWHKALRSSLWLHIGLSHGAITSLEGQADDIPVNKLFLPGGDNSIRGYQRGEAAPRGLDGRFVGAHTYTILNLELEQAITNNWSVVLFLDSLGTAVDVHDYPFKEKLYSAGIGIRYNTIIGPLRLEYGRNLKRRDLDPLGTLHFSIGFPF